MDNQYYIETIADAGLSIQLSDQRLLLIILLDIEDILDKGRGMISPDLESRKEINQKLQELR